MSYRTGDLILLQFNHTVAAKQRAGFIKNPVQPQSFLQDRELSLASSQLNHAPLFKAESLF